MMPLLNMMPLLKKTSLLKKTLSLCLVSLAGGGLCAASPVPPDPAGKVPTIGAQIWIEPGSTPAQIDGWFAALEDAHMRVARLFLMWPYLAPGPGKWNFSVYDEAFSAAARHHVRIVATLTPSGRPRFLGGSDAQGGGLPDLRESNAALAEYLRQTISHFRNSPALDSWLLLNEPGQEPTASPEAVASFRTWLKQRYGSVDALNRAWGASFPAFDDAVPPSHASSWGFADRTDWYVFWATFQTQQLSVLAERVRRLDPGHPLHLNPHALVSNLAQLSDDLPTWRPFLDSLGCSIHPAWHFGLLDPDQYELGVSFVNSLVRGAIEPKPYWVTELQGGNNIYSGSTPLEPSPEQISSWVWTSVGSGADRVIFWLLNARTAGVEAGEWSLLTYDGKPSARLEAASKVAETIQRNAAFFASARPLPPPLTILLSNETMALEGTEIEGSSGKAVDGRSPNAHTLEALGFYRASASLGVPAAIRFIGDFDWNGRGQMVIVPDARVLTPEQIEHLAAFADAGNRVLVSGLSGFYDQHGKAMALGTFPLSSLVRARLREVHTQSGRNQDAPLPWNGTALPVHLLRGTITAAGAQPVDTVQGEVVASRAARSRGGSVLWIPSLVGIAAMKSDVRPLAAILQTELQGLGSDAPGFVSASDGCVLQAMHADSRLLTVVSNGKAEPRTCVLRLPGHGSPSALEGRLPTHTGTGWTFELGPNQAAVALWGDAPR